MEHESLLKEWESRTRDLGGIIKDGIIDPALWDSASLRILLILKDGYNSDHSLSGWDLRDEIRKGMVGVTCRKAAYWMYCILNNQDTPSNVSLVQAHEALRSTAIINVKKTPGTTKASSKELLEHTKLCGDLLANQISIINPQLVICGYTWYLVKPLVGESESVSELISKNQTGLSYVDFWHPANRFPDLMNCITLVQVLRNGGILTVPGGHTVREYG